MLLIRNTDWNQHEMKVVTHVEMHETIHLELLFSSVPVDDGLVAVYLRLEIDVSICVTSTFLGKGAHEFEVRIRFWRKFYSHNFSDSETWQL